MDIDDIRTRFNYHPPKSEAVRNAHEGVRAKCRELALAIDEAGPDGREKSLAITHIEDAMMWANAMIARHPEAFPDDEQPDPASAPPAAT